MIPPLDDRGLLPPGIHETAGWDELHNRFATNKHRIKLFKNLLTFRAEHLAPVARGLDLYLTGSFLSDKVRPGDIDCAVTVPIAQLSQRVPLLSLGAHGNKGPFYKEMRVEFYLTIEPGDWRLNDFLSFFQYVGEKTAVAKSLNAKDLRGIVKVVSWDQ